VAIFMIADRRFRSHLDGCIFAPRWIDLPRAFLNGERRVGAAADA
jgi:hypothetical protein